MNLDDMVRLSNITLSGMFDEVVAKYPDKEAFVFQDTRVTYRQAQEQVNRFAKGLLALGVKKGDKVAIWMTNNLEWIYSAYAIWKIGAVVVTISTRFKSEEAKYNLLQSDVTTLIMNDKFLGKIEAIEMLKEMIPELSVAERGKVNAPHLPFLKNVICLGETDLTGVYAFNEIMESGRDRSLDDKLLEVANSVSPADVCTHLYTSGTTGRPKAALGHHRGWMANHLSLTFHYLELTSKDKVLAVLPFFGGMGLAQVTGPILAGPTLFIMETFDAKEALELIERERITAGYVVVPSVYIMMFDHPDLNKYDVSSLKRTFLSGMPATPELIRALQDKMGLEKVLDHYAMIESHGSGTVADPVALMDDLASPEGTVVGFPDPHVRIKIVDPGTGEELPAGRDGEICLKANRDELRLSLGYYKMPKETGELIDRDGWTHMADIGHIREGDGALLLTGRVSDMFIVGGFNVYPPEIESILLRDPRVKRVAVVGVPDKRLGEVPMAFVQLKVGQVCTEAEITDFCRSNLANFKVPKYVKFINEFPLAGQDKIQKFRLREMAIKELGL